MMQHRPHNRSLEFERLEAKTSPASLLEAISVFDSDPADAQSLEQATPHASVEVAALQAPASLHWTCVPTSQEILQFVETNTVEGSLNSVEEDQYEFHRMQDDDYVVAADHAIEQLSGAMLKATLATDHLELP